MSPILSKNRSGVNSHAVGLDSWVQTAIKSIFWETLFLDQPHIFRYYPQFISFQRKIILTPIFEINFGRNNIIFEGWFSKTNTKIIIFGYYFDKKNYSQSIFTHDLEQVTKCFQNEDMLYIWSETISHPDSVGVKISFFTWSCFRQATSAFSCRPQYWKVVNWDRVLGIYRQLWCTQLQRKARP